MIAEVSTYDAAASAANALRVFAVFAAAVAAPFACRLAVWAWPLAVSAARWASSVEFGWAFERAAGRALSAAGRAIAAPFRYAGRAWRRLVWRVCVAGDTPAHQLAHYAEELPPHNGLTQYEEWVAECAALPPGPARAALRRELRRFKPSAHAVARARAKRGESRVDCRIYDALRYA